MTVLKKIRQTIRIFISLYKGKVPRAWFEVVEGIMKFALDVQQNGKPMLTKIAAVDMTGKSPITQIDIVGIWAAVGDLTPLDRISHLVAQNIELKRLLKMSQEKLIGQENEDLRANIFLILKTFE